MTVLWVLVPQKYGKFILLPKKYQNAKIIFCFQKKRNLLREGKSIKYLTPDPVVEYLETHKLFQ